MKNISLNIVSATLLLSVSSGFAMEEAKTSFHAKAALVRGKMNQVDQQLQIDLAAATTDERYIWEVNQANMRKYFLQNKPNLNPPLLLGVSNGSQNLQNQQIDPKDSIDSN